VAAKAEFPEPAFAQALYYVASGSEPIGRMAVDWALGPGNDLRQLALVYDWCQKLLGTRGDSLAAKIATALRKPLPPNAHVNLARAYAMAAIAISDEQPELAESTLRTIVESWWKTNVLAVLAQSQLPFQPADHLALFEMLHVIRDNLDVDLRETSAKFFTTLPIYHILAHYPAPFPAAENEYRIPLMPAHAEPDLRQAVFTRAAALSMVALDNNSQEMQFLQGWLIQDRYLMRGTYGIPYEFLWANPYQPGLSFHYLPNIYHDPITGRLIVRSTWEDDATWYYQAGGVIQLFHNGEIENLKEVGMKQPLLMGNTVLHPASLGMKFSFRSEDEPLRYYVVGLKPKTRYDLEIDDESLRDVDTDTGGVLDLRFAPRRVAGVLLRESPPPSQ